MIDRETFILRELGAFVKRSHYLADKDRLMLYEEALKQAWDFFSTNRLSPVRAKDIITIEGAKDADKTRKPEA